MQLESFCRTLRARADDAGDTVYLVQAESGKELTYAQTWDLALRWATWIHRSGVSPGDRVATTLRNGIHTVPMTAGIALAGAIEAPLNIQYQRPQFEYAVHDADPALVVVDDEFFEVVRDATPDGIAVECFAEVNAGIADTDPAEVADPDLPDVSDVAWILYTSGTTGPSKGVMMPWGQVWSMAEGAMPEGVVTPEDVWYVPYPLSHVSGRTGPVKMASVGGRAVLRRAFSTSEFWNDVRTYGVTGTLLMGATLAFLASQPPSPADREHRLRKVLMAPLPRDLDEVRNRFGFNATTVFNMTEISSPIVSDGYVEEYTEACGYVREGFQCRVVDDLDREVPDGTVGELLVRSDVPWSLNLGYWRKPEATVQAWRNLWFHTGDAFKKYPDGSFVFVDRMKDCIRRRGENISSMEVESVVQTHPAVSECAAFGVPSAYTEEDVKLAMVKGPESALTAQDLASYLSDRLPRYAQPEFIEFVDDLPRTASEKIKKAELRKRHDPERCSRAPFG